MTPRTRALLLTTATIAVAVVFGLVGLVVFGGASAFYEYRKRQQQKKKKETPK